MDHRVRILSNRYRTRWRVWISPVTDSHRISRMPTSILYPHYVGQKPIYPFAQHCYIIMSVGRCVQVQHKTAATPAAHTYQGLQRLYIHNRVAAKTVAASLQPTLTIRLTRSWSLIAPFYQLSLECTILRLPMPCIHHLHLFPPFFYIPFYSLQKKKKA